MKNAEKQYNMVENIWVLKYHSLSQILSALCLFLISGTGIGRKNSPDWHAQEEVV